MKFTVNEREGATVIELSGRFDNYTAPEIRELLQRVSVGPAPHLVVDMEAVSFIDSTGLATLVQGLKRSREHGGDLRLCALQAPVRMIFELTRLDKAFEILPTVDDALAAVGEGHRLKQLDD